jgi:hypothetical protein
MLAFPDRTAEDDGVSEDEDDRSRDMTDPDTIDLIGFRHVINDCLNPRERRIVVWGLGLDGTVPMFSDIIDPEEVESASRGLREPRTRKQIMAARLQITVPRMSDIMDQALVKLRAALAAPAD